MIKAKWFYHPIAVFIFSLVALGVSLFLYIHWYLQVSAVIQNFVQKFNLDPMQFFTAETWVIILILSLLVATIVFGIFIIFIYYQKVIQLYRLQQNFINGFTHELKTPIASLKLFLDTFLKHDLPRDDQKKYLSFMLRDTDRLSENVNRILNLSKMEDKKYVTTLVDSDLADLIQQFIEKNSNMLEGCKVTFSLEGKFSPICSVNQQSFEMFLANLVSNAIKYNSSDVPIITIIIETLPKKVILRIKDNGMGIEKSEIKKIFRKFYQIGKADDMSARGRGGLGLYISQQFSKIHRGKIWAESKGLGQGAEFSLILPRVNRKIDGGKNGKEKNISN